MENKKHTFFWILGGALILIGSGFLFWSDLKEPIVNSEPILPVTGDRGNVPVNSQGGEEGGGLIIELVEEGEEGVSLPPGVTAPNVDRPIVITANLTEAQKAKARQDIEKLRSDIRANSNSLESWVYLGLQYKTIGDTEGAREAWEFASLIRPKNSVSFSNLALLYGYYLNDVQKGEKNMLIAIQNDPKMPYLYIQASDYYLEVLKDKAKAKAILEQGLKQVPDDPGLKAALEAVK